MNWEDWAKAYPAKKVTEKPENYHKDEVFDNYLEAVSYQENLEIEQEMGGFEIVEFSGKFYIVNA